MVRRKSQYNMRELESTTKYNHSYIHSHNTRHPPLFPTMHSSLTLARGCIGDHTQVEGNSWNVWTFFFEVNRVLGYWWLWITSGGIYESVYCISNSSDPNRTRTRVRNRAVCVMPVCQQSSHWQLRSLNQDGGMAFVGRHQNGGTTVKSLCTCRRYCWGERFEWLRTRSRQCTVTKG